jgi:hypothetical protein
MAVFFSRIGSKSTSEWKEEIIYFDPGKSNAPALQNAAFPDRAKVRLNPGEDPREVFAHWLISPKNKWFNRAICNRVWAWFFGRGIIHEVDDLRPDNPPSQPEALAFLEQELTAAKYDLRHLFRLILNSQTYQQSSRPAGGEAAAAEAAFACYPVRRIEAEVLVDAINQVTGTTETYMSAIPEPYTFVPEGTRAISLPDGSITSSFLELFGKPPRDTGMEGERNSRLTAAQRLHLLNSSHIQRKIDQGTNLQFVVKSGIASAEAVSGLYLTILSRYPTPAEIQTALGYAKTSGLRSREAALDLAWALLNSSEFVYKH